LTSGQSDYFFLFFLEAFFFVAFLAFFFAAMINSSIVCSGQSDLGHPPKHEEYERLAFKNATPPGLFLKRDFSEINKTLIFIGLNATFFVWMIFSCFKR
jgi:hypothetical protein